MSAYPSGLSKRTAVPTIDMFPSLVLLLFNGMHNRLMGSYPVGRAGGGANINE